MIQYTMLDDIKNVTKITMSKHYGEEKVDG